MPRTLLQINSSLFSQGGQSSQLADAFVSAWTQAHPQGRVVKRDLSSDPVPHLDGERFTAFLAGAEDRTPAQQDIIAYSDRLIAELLAADVVVLGVPMYNFGIPSVLKAYIDHIARAGITFRYTESGPVGLLTGKTVYVFATRGGQYAGTPKDSQTSYLRDVLGFLGITEVEFVYAEGLALGENSKAAALANARETVTHLVHGTI